YSSTPCNSHHDPRYLHSLPTRRSSDLNSETHHQTHRYKPCHLQLRVIPRQLCLWAMTITIVLLQHPIHRWYGPQNQTPPHHLHIDRKSTRLNSSHVKISYAVFCLKKKT